MPRYALGKVDKAGASGHETKDAGHELRHAHVDGSTGRVTGTPRGQVNDVRREFSR